MTVQTKDVFFDSMIQKYNAQRISFGKPDKRYPRGSDIPLSVVWFETRNFGWILGPQTKTGRKVLLKW